MQQFELLFPGQRPFITADQHFGHGNIAKYENRPADWERTAVTHWNEVVSPEDWVLHLGDVSFSSLLISQHLLETLNGYKVLVLGNHDGTPTRMKNMGFNEVYGSRTAGRNADSQEYGLVIPDENDKRAAYVLSHRPLSREYWNANVMPKYPRAINYHGHVHSNPYEKEEYHVNVSVDVRDYYPIRLGER